MKKIVSAILAAVLCVMLALPVCADSIYTDLNKGDKGENVQMLMQRLADLGYYTKSVDDSYGPGMVRALKLYYAQNGMEGDGTSVPAAAQQQIFSDAAPMRNVTAPVIRDVALESYNGTPVLTLRVSNPLDSELSFLSVLFRCFDAAGNEIYAGTVGQQQRYVRFKDIELGIGDTLDTRTIGAVDLSAYPGVSKVMAAVYCYRTEKDTYIVPEPYFRWVDSDGNVTGDSFTHDQIKQQNCTAEQEKIATSFDLGIDFTFIYNYESANWGLPCGLYVNQAGGKMAQAGVQPGDVILSIANCPLNYEESYYLIKSLMQDNCPYDMIVYRNGEQLTMQIMK